jgi:hypothetical protein
VQTPRPSATPAYPEAYARLERSRRQVLSPLLHLFPRLRLLHSCRQPASRWPRWPDVLPRLRGQSLPDDYSSLSFLPLPDGYSSLFVRLLQDGCSPPHFPSFPDGCSSRRALVAQHVHWARDARRGPRFGDWEHCAVAGQSAVALHAEVLHAEAQSVVEALHAVARSMACCDSDPMQKPGQPGKAPARPSSVTYFHLSKCDSLPPPELQNLYSCISCRPPPSSPANWETLKGPLLVDY